VALAKSWLSRLRLGIARGAAMSVPFGDPDLVSTVRNGDAADLVYANALGAAVTTQVLGSPVSNAVAWPADGTADAPTLSALSNQRPAGVILSDRYVTTSSTLSYTPSAIGPVNGSKSPGIVFDSQLSDLFTAAPGNEGPVLARQRVLAELAMITEEQPFAQRSVVIVPPRRWTPISGYTSALLQAMSAAPWVKMETLPDLLTAYTGGGVQRQQPRYPSSVSKSELPAAQYQAIRAARAELQAFEDVLKLPAGQRYPAAVSLDRGLLRSESTYWRDKNSQGLRYVLSVKSAVEKLQAGVHVINSGSLTLTAHSGRLPVTVVNNTSVPVNLLVVLTAEPEIRLKLTQQPLPAVAAGGQATIEVPAQATADGLVTVVARLYTPSHEPYGQPVTFPVQVSGYGTVAQIVVGFALALLAIAVVARIVGAVRRGRRPGSAASARELVR
jgi:hypothetical protein